MTGFSINSADRCLAILELLADNPLGLSLGDIAEGIGLPVSACHRLLAVLKGRRYVQQGGANAPYVATLRVATLGLRVLEASTGLDICQPALDEIADISGELVRLSVVEAGELLWIGKAQGSRSNIRYDPLNGHRLPYYATAAGKIWLASLPVARAVEIIEAQGFPRDSVGPNAPKSLEAVLSQLQQARSDGFALVEEELEADISAIAVAIHQDGNPVLAVDGCLSIGGPTFRLNRGRLQSFLPALRSTSLVLSEIWQLRHRLR